MVFIDITNKVENLFYHPNIGYVIYYNLELLEQ